MISLTRFLEYLIVAYVMIVGIMIGLYIMEHFEIRMKPKESDDTTKDLQSPLTVVVFDENYENNQL